MKATEEESLVPSQKLGGEKDRREKYSNDGYVLDARKNSEGKFIMLQSER